MRTMTRRDATPAPGPSSRTGLMPEALASEQLTRLAVFSATGAGLWLFGVVMEAVVVPLLLGGPTNWMGVAIETTGLLASLAMYGYVRSAAHAVETKTAVSLAYLVFNALGVALINTIALRTGMPDGPQVSWNAVLILVFSMVAPTTPLRILGASLIAASMDPLVTLAAQLTGHVEGRPIWALVYYLPNYVCAVLAMTPSRVLTRMGRRLQEAQDLGSYRLMDLLGHGGMGEVWSAQHRLLARSAAVKLVRPEVLGASTPDEARLILRRFEREARATAALNSPHTIQVFDFGTTSDGNFYYVMELLSGRDLESLVREFGPVPADRMVYLLRQVCHSLADAHARGLVHRDIKPANIYICRMGLEYDFIKVLDFGLVKFSDRADRQPMLTREHQTTGTPAYMAPEIILGEADVDRRADVYAVGCVAYYLLTGQLVFEGDTPMKVLMQHVQSEPLPPSARTELPISQEIDDLVLACLRKDPDSRPQNAEEVLRLCYRCHAAWDQQAARTWWEQHLPELTGPLAMVQTVEA